MVFPTQRPVQDSDGLMYGLEISGEGGHWVEFSRMLAPNGLDDTMQEMMTAYAGVPRTDAGTHESRQYR